MRQEIDVALPTTWLETRGRERQRERETEKNRHLATGLK